MENPMLKWEDQGSHLSAVSARAGATREAQRRRPCSAARWLRASASRDLRTGGRGEARGALRWKG